MWKPDSIVSSLRWMWWFMAAQVTWRGTPWRSPPQLQQLRVELTTPPAAFDLDAEPLAILCMVRRHLNRALAPATPQVPVT